MVDDELVSYIGQGGICISVYRQELLKQPGTEPLCPSIPLYFKEEDTIHGSLRITQSSDPRNYL